MVNLLPQRTGCPAADLDTETGRKTNPGYKNLSLPQKSEAAPLTVTEEPSPFFEPLIRSFVLGLSSGALCELVHVSSKASACNDTSDGQPRVRTPRPRNCSRMDAYRYKPFSWKLNFPVPSPCA